MEKCRRQRTFHSIEEMIGKENVHDTSSAFEISSELYFQSLLKLPPGLDIEININNPAMCRGVGDLIVSETVWQFDYEDDDESYCKSSISAFELDHSNSLNKAKGETLDYL